MAGDGGMTLRADGRAAREARPPQQRHERVEQQRDQPGDDEEQQDRAGSAASAQTPSSASGSTTSWIQRGTMTGATCAGGSGGGGEGGARRAAAPGPGLDRPRLGRVRRCPVQRRACPSVCAPGRLEHVGAGTVKPVTAILFVGDIVASAGRRTLRTLLPGLREELALDFVVANGENAAGGIGITPKHADELFAAGRRRDHARQPHLPSPRGLALPRRAAQHPAARRTSCAPSPGAARACSSAMTAPRSASSTCRGTSSCRRRAPAFVDDRGRAARGRRRRPRARRHARRGDE